MELISIYGTTRIGLRQADPWVEIGNLGLSSCNVLLANTFTRFRATLHRAWSVNMDGALDLPLATAWVGVG